MPVNLPTNLLRSFVAIVDRGSMLNAAEQVYVTQSALSLQIRRLEELVQQTLFAREGRRLALTPSGAVLLDYARRVLSLHDEALAAISGEPVSGPVRMGMVQDFADALLPGALASFAALHPASQIYARVAGTSELQHQLERNQLDVIVGFTGADDPTAIRTAPTSWFGDEDLAAAEVIPLALLERPCRFREAALTSLDAAGRRYRIAVETPNLSTLRAAVQGGLGITCRSQLFLRELVALPADVLPTLPSVACFLARGRQLNAAARRLADLTVETLRAL
jgi:DNA-binding transcriptional LysR family regulator